MASDEIRRNMALFSIGTVMKLTDLSARQIRYYEQHELIRPARTSGKQRLFSFNDVERLLEIKSLIEQGVNIAGIKQVMKSAEGAKQAPDVMTNTRFSKRGRGELTDPEVHQFLRTQLRGGLRKGQASLIQGELYRYYKKQI